MSMNFATNLLPNEDQAYNLGSSDKKWKIFSEPGIIDTRTYTNVIATANDQNGAGFFYLKYRGTTFNQKWHIKVRVHAIVPGYEDYDTETIFDLWGYGSTYSWYACLNRIKTTSYRPIYYNSNFRVSSTGYNNGCGGWLGFSLLSATNQTNTSYKRTVVVDLLEYSGCTIEMQDALITPTNIPNRAGHTDWYSSTNTSYDNFDAANYGLKQTGDNNTTTIVNLYCANGDYVADSAIYRYQFLFAKDENILTPLNNVSNTIGTSKTMLTTVEFNPFKDIYFYNSTTTVSASSGISAGALYYALNGIDLRYTFNCGTTLTSHKPFYLVVTPTSNSKCKIASSTPWAQTLPSTNDGNWYILLGRTYSTYQLVLYPTHPVYMHDGTSLHQVLPQDATVTSTTAGLMSAQDKTRLDTMYTAISNLQEEIGIVINGNTAARSVAPGQYVIVKNSTITGITNGLYKYSGSTTKTAGNSFTSSELTPEPEGGLNALNGNLTNRLSFQTFASNNTTINANSYGVFTVSITVPTKKKGYILSVSGNSDELHSLCINNYNNGALAAGTNVIKVNAYATYTSNGYKAFILVCFVPAT